MGCEILTFGVDSIWSIINPPHWLIVPDHALNVKGFLYWDFRGPRIGNRNRHIFMASI